MGNTYGNYTIFNPMIQRTQLIQWNSRKKILLSKNSAKQIFEKHNFYFS